MYLSTLSLRDGQAAPVLYSWSGYATYNRTADVRQYIRHINIL